MAFPTDSEYRNGPETIYKRRPEENIADLQLLFKDSPDDLFVRGSFVRGDVPYGDIDISAYNMGGKYLSKNLPTNFYGIPINYGGIPLEELDNYFSTCLRGSSSLMETLPLSTVNAAPLHILTEQ